MTSNCLLTINQDRAIFEQTKEEVVIEEGEPGERLSVPSARDAVDVILIIEPQHR